MSGKVSDCGEERVECIECSKWRADEGDDGGRKAHTTVEEAEE